MTKFEIIQALADCTIPEGATLMEHSTPPGITVSRISSGQKTGLNIMMSRMFANGLEVATLNFPNKVSSALLKTIHETVVSFHERSIEALTIPELAKDLIDNHRKIVEKLRQIAKELGITYQEPKDSLL